MLDPAAVLALGRDHLKLSAVETALALMAAVAEQPSGATLAVATLHDAGLIEVCSSLYPLVLVVHRQVSLLQKHANMPHCTRP